LSFHHCSIPFVSSSTDATLFSRSIWTLNISSLNRALQIPGPGCLGPRHFGVAPSILPSIYFYIVCSFRFWKTPVPLLAHRGVAVVRLSEWWMFPFAARNFRLRLIGPGGTHALLPPSPVASQG
jgi:hypothetical protein